LVPGIESGTASPVLHNLFDTLQYRPCQTLIVSFSGQMGSCIVVTCCCPGLNGRACDFPPCWIRPGSEGNVSVKWLAQVRVTDQPAHFKDETSRYTDLLAGGRSLQFTFPLVVKSVITSPGGQRTLDRQGAPALLQSLAIGNSGNMQPSRELWLQQYGAFVQSG